MTGTNGTRNGRGASGCVRRMISTAAHTITKASSVPMLVSSPGRRNGRKAAMVATKTPVRIVDFQGVRNLRMNRGEETGAAPAVAGHRQQDARLAEHHHQQHGGDAGDGADGDEELGPGQAHLAKGVGYRRVNIDLVVGHHAREHGGDGDVQAPCR